VAVPRDRRVTWQYHVTAEKEAVLSEKVASVV